MGKIQVQSIQGLKSWASRNSELTIIAMLVAIYPLPNYLGKANRIFLYEDS